jgi:hypothetical protein
MSNTRQSAKSAAIAVITGAGKTAGGSHATREARETHLTRFVEACYDRGQQIRGVESIRASHVQAYVAERLARGDSLRSIQNGVSAVRVTMRCAGRDQATKDPAFSTKALGLAGASRLGTSTAATPEQYRAARELVGAREPGVAACLALAKTLGLRQMEAVRAGESLARWEGELKTAGRVTVTQGTKGGREREAVAPDRAAALTAVREARAVLNGKGYLVDRPDLEKAYRAMENQMRHCEISTHQLRYSYARDLMTHYTAQDYSRKDALAATSLSLGHGDGRGDYVARVYLR